MDKMGSHARKSYRNCTILISARKKGRGLFKESGLKGRHYKHGAVYRGLTKVLVTHGMQTPHRFRDVKNNRANRLKIRDQISFSSSE